MNSIRKIIILLLSSLPLAALEPILITEPEGKIVLGLHTEYMEDKDGMAMSGNWKPVVMTQSMMTNVKTRLIASLQRQPNPVGRKANRKI